jgi:hypothetical protein
MRIQKKQGQEARRLSCALKLTRRMVLASSLIATAVAASSTVASGPSSAVANPLRSGQPKTTAAQHVFAIPAAKTLPAQKTLPARKALPSVSTSATLTTARQSPKPLAEQVTVQRMFRVAMVDTTNVVSIDSSDAVDSNQATPALRPDQKRFHGTGLATDCIGFFDPHATPQNDVSTIGEGKDDSSSSNQLRDQRAAENFRRSAQNFVELFPVNPYRIR